LGTHRFTAVLFVMNMAVTGVVITIVTDSIAFPVTVGTVARAVLQESKNRKGEIGCVFDKIQNLVEPIERLDMGEQYCGERRHPEVSAGLRTKQDCAVKRSRQGRSETMDGGAWRSESRLLLAVARRGGLAKDGVTYA